MKTAIMIVITLALTAGLLYGEASEVTPPTPVQEQPEVLNRGPVHEAFAEPVDLQVQEGLVAPTQPPPNIVENPPAERPAGNQFVWVSGYWGWDGERNSYIWVSGCWRAAPPNRYWVPGYWTHVPEGWQWVPGFWTPVTDVQQIEYLPAPPALDNVQPLVPSLSTDNIWVPPCWYWYHGQYVLRSGYWLAAQADWVWAPSHYVWTPRGYVFVEGHWDYSLGRRGVLFAPVYLPRPVYERPGFSLSLGVVVDTGTLQFSMFTCPRYSHYYFGDYYDDAYVGIGIYPWFECERLHTWYDPIYEHDRWSHRRIEPGWDEHQRNEYALRRADRNLRPPKMYNEVKSRQTALPVSQRRNIQMAEPLSTVAADKKNPMKFEQLKTGARQKLSMQATDLHKYSEERNRWESASAGPKTVQPPLEHKGPVTPPTEHRESVTPSTERKEPATSSAAREPTFVPPREVHLTQPEQVKIPSSPVVGRRGGLGIFEKGPPSRPAGEQKTEVKNTRGDKDTRRDNDAPMDSDAPRDRHQHGDGRN
jgi:hypothetical protein